MVSFLLMVNLFRDTGNPAIKAEDISLNYRMMGNLLQVNIVTGKVTCQKKVMAMAGMQRDCKKITMAKGDHVELKGITTGQTGVGDFVDSTHIKWTNFYSLPPTTVSDQNTLIWADGVIWKRTK